MWWTSILPGCGGRVSRKERIGSRMGEEGKEAGGDSTTGGLYMSDCIPIIPGWRPRGPLE